MSEQFLFKTKKFPRTVKMAGLSEKNYRALVEIGLPQWVAPHLYFGGFDNVFLPKLKDWSWISDWDNYSKELFKEYKECRIIGSSDEHAPFFLLPGKDEINTFVPKINEAVIVNTSIEKLLQTLNEYSMMIEIAFLKNKKTNLAIDKVPEKTMEIFLNNYKKIEVSLMNKPQFWRIISEKYSE